MVDCTELRKGGKHEAFGQIYNQAFSLDTLLRRGLLEGRISDDFLCPINIDSLNVQGGFESDVFQYVKIELAGCQLGPNECAPDDEVARNVFNLVTSESIPNVLGQTREEQVIHLTGMSSFFYIDPTRIQ